MSIDDLRADLDANMRELKSLSALSTIGDVVGHLQNTLWPFLQNVTQELTDQDEAMHDLYNNAEDILQHETGKLLAGIVVGGLVLVGELEKIVAQSADPAAKQLMTAIREWKVKAKEAGEIIEEITLPEQAEYDEDEDEEDDDADGDDDDGDEPGEPANGNEPTKGGAPRA